MTQVWDEARVERAAKSYRRFERIKMVASGILVPVEIIVSIWFAINVNLLVGLLVLFVGVPVVLAVVSPLVMLPIGYLFCGPDALRLGREVVAAEEKRRRGY